MNVILFLLILLCPAIMGCDLSASAEPVEFIDLKPHAEVKTQPEKPVVYFYTQKSCRPCKPQEKYWEDHNWETPSFRVKKVDIGEQQAPEWVDHTPCYGWTIGEQLYVYGNGRPVDQLEGSWKAANK